MPIPPYQAGQPESRASRIGTAVVGAAMLSGMMIVLASTVQGPDGLGAALFAGIGIFVMFLFVVFIVAASARRSQSPKMPAPVPEQTPGVGSLRTGEPETK